MIQKPKIQLSRPLISAVVSLALLSGLFLYSHASNPSFFKILILEHLIIVGALVFMRQRYISTKSKIGLQKQDFVERANLSFSDIKREKLALESSQKKIVSYSNLKELTEKLILCLSLSDTSRTLSTEVSDIFEKNDTTTILYLFHGKTGELGLSSSQKGQMRVNIKSKKGDIFDNWVVKTMQPLLVQDTLRDFRFDSSKVRLQSEGGRKFRSIISAPLTLGDRALGILRVDSIREGSFATEDLRFLCAIADVGAVAIENAQLYERVEKLAIKDSLTDLYLRRYLITRLSEELSRQLRRKKPLSFLMLDLDKFKNYNDKFGHMAGDIVLKTIGAILKNSFREPGNLVSRYGGEEFAILLPDISKEEAVKLAEELRKKIKKQEIVLRKQKTHITISTGVAAFPDDAQIKDDLIQAADNALYKAKSRGRDKVCYI